MNRLGVPCKIVTGMGSKEAHTWNQIKIDGNWYMVDSTWDDAGDGKDSEHQYFMCSENAFPIHTWDKESHEPCTDTNFDKAFWKPVNKNIYGYQGGDCTM